MSADRRPYVPYDPVRYCATADPRVFDVPLDRQAYDGDVPPWCRDDMPTEEDLDRYAREREARADAELMLARAIDIPRAVPTPVLRVVGGRE
jgi:hypothetical protein